MIIRRNHIPALGRSVAAAAALLLLPHCAPVAVRKPAPPMTAETMVGRISMIRDQQERVHTFFSSGTVRMEKPGYNSQAHILIAGNREPLKIKIEITHAWGRPLLHLLVRESTLDILSFHEKRLYRGPLGRMTNPGFLPAALTPRQIWAVLRGFPALPDHHRAVSRAADELSLLSERGSPIQVVGFDPGTGLPNRLFYPAKGITVSFSRFHQADGVAHARDVTVSGPEADATFSMEIQRMVCNEGIPDSIFQMPVPAGFETHDLPDFQGR